MSDDLANNSPLALTVRDEQLLILAFIRLTPNPQLKMHSTF